MYWIIYLVGFVICSVVFTRVIARDDLMSVERNADDRFVAFFAGVFGASLWPIVLPLGGFYFVGKDLMFPQVREYERKVDLRKEYGRLAEDALTMASVFREANMLDEAKRQEDMYRQYRKKESELW